MLQVAISAANAATTVFIMYQQRRWTNGEPVPRWILTLTLIAPKKNNKVTETTNAFATFHHYKVGRFCFIPV